MKITDVTLTLFAWDDIPATHVRPPHRPLRRQERARPRSPSRPTRASRATPSSARRSAAPPSTAPVADRQVAQADRARPGPARPRAPLSAHVAAHARARPRARASAPSTWRSGTSPARSPTADPPAARLLSRPACRPTRARPCSPSPEAYAEEALRFKARRLDRLQDPPADRSGATTSRSARPCARRSATTTRLMLDSTWAYDYPDGAPGRPGDRGARLLLVRGPAGRRRSLQLRQAQAAALDPDPRHRVRAGRPHRLRALAHAAGHRLPARRRRGEGRDHRAASRPRTSPRAST